MAVAATSACVLLVIVGLVVSSGRSSPVTAVGGTLPQLSQLHASAQIDVGHAALRFKSAITGTQFQSGDRAVSDKSIWPCVSVTPTLLL